MKLKFKRFMAMFLSIMMIVSIVPTGVFAADDNGLLVVGEGNDQSVAKVGDKEYATLQDAFDAAKDGETIELLANVSLTGEVLTISGEGKKTLDLNGHTITGTFTEKTTAFVYVTGGCELTIKDSSEDEKGGIEAVDTNGMLSNLIRVETDGKLVIESGNFEQDASVNGAGMIDSRGDEIITIKGGNFHLDNIGSASNGSPWIFNASGQNTKNIIVIGGTFNDDIFHQYYIFEVKDTTEVAALLGVPEKAAKNNGDGTWTVVDAVVLVNEQHQSGNWYTQNTGFVTLVDAITKAKAGETVTLLKDVNETANVDKSIILDLNDKKFTGTLVLTDANATLTAPEGLNVISGVEGYAANYDEDGKYTLEKNYIKWIKEQLLAGNDVKLDRDVVLNDINYVEALKAASNGNGEYCGFNYGNGAFFNIIGGDVTFDLNGHSITYDIHDAEWCNKRVVSIFYVTDKANLTIIDSSENESGAVTVNGMATAVYSVAVDTKVEIKGGTWTWNPCKTCGATNAFLYASHGGELYITDGFFVNNVEGTAGEYMILAHYSSKETTENSAGVDYDSTKIAISGGTFKNYNPGRIKYMDRGNGNAESMDNGCAEGYESMVNGDGMYGVKKIDVAQIGETKYASLQEAIDKAETGDTIVLLENIDLAKTELQTLDGSYDTYFLVENKSVTIDLAGKTISGEYTGDTGDSMLVGVFSTDNNGHLTLTGNGTVDVTATDTVYGLLVNYEDGCFLTVENGTYKLDKASDSLIYSGSDESITIEGGNFHLGNVGTGSNGSPWIFNAKGQNTRNIIVIGGTFNADIIHQYYPFEVMAPREKALRKDADGMWRMVEAVAYVNEQEWSSAWYTNEVGYATLAEAIAAVEAVRTKNGKTSEEEFVTIIDKITLTESLGKEGVKVVGNVILGAANVVFTVPKDDGLNVTSGVDGYDVIYDADEGAYKLTMKPVAQIGETKYATLQDAIDKAKTGDTIVVLENINLAKTELQTLGGKYNTYFLVADKSVTIDLNEKTISGEYTGESMLVGVFSTDDNGHLTLTGNGTVDVTATKTVYGLLVNYGAGCSLTVENGTYKLDKASDSLIYSDSDESITIKGGNFTLGNVGTGSNGSPWIFNAKGQNERNIIVIGGTFNADIFHQYYIFEVKDTTEVAELLGVPAKAAKNNGDGTWTVVDAVALVNEQHKSGNWYTQNTGYVTLADAIAAVESTGSEQEEFVTIIGEITLTESLGKEGVKVVGKVVLGAADVVFTVPEDAGLTVTTNVADHKVVYEDGSYKVKPILFSIRSSSLVLGNDLSMWFYVSNDDLDDLDNGTDYVAVVTKSYADGRANLVVEIPFEKWESTSGNRMRFRFDGIAAKEMADNVSVIVKTSTGEVVSKKFNDSIRGYVERGFATGKAQENKLLATMLVDMLNYGAAAQNMFKYGQTDLANKNMTAYQSLATQTQNVTCENKQEKGSGYKSLSLTLECNIQFNMKFDKTVVTKDMTAVVTFTDHYGRSHTIEISGDKFVSKGDVWSIPVEGLVVADFEQLVTCKFKDANGAEVAGVYGIDSMESFCARAIAGGGGSDYEDIAKFMTSAHIYLHSNNQ